MKRGQLVILLFAALAVGLIAFAGGGNDDKGAADAGIAGTPQGAKAPAGALRGAARRPAGHVPVLAREGAAAEAADRALQRVQDPGGRQGGVRRRPLGVVG